MNKIKIRKYLISKLKKITLLYNWIYYFQFFKIIKFWMLKVLEAT